MFLLLILVHLQFPLGVLRLAALLGFPCWLLLSEWQTVREALLFLLCPDGCRRFIGVRGGGLLLLGLRVSGSGCRLLPDPFRRFSVPPLAGLGGAGVRRLGCRVAAAGLLSALPRHSSCSIVPIPMPSSSPISIPGAALGKISLVLVAKVALELAPLPSPSQGLLWRISPWSWLPRMLWSLLHSLLQASTAFCS